MISVLPRPVKPRPRRRLASASRCCSCKGHLVAIKTLSSMRTASRAARFIFLKSKPARSEEHTSELQSLMRISYAVFCLKKKKHKQTHQAVSQQQTYMINRHTDT